MPKKRTPAEITLRNSPVVDPVVSDDFDDLDDPFISRAEMLAVEAGLKRELDRLLCPRPAVSKKPVR